MKTMNSMKKMFLASMIFLWASSVLMSGVSHWWSYPVKEVSQLSCKRQSWDQLDAKCKQPLPRIKNAEYSKYDKNTAYTYIYSTLWGATYTNWWDFWKGAHEWVDIATSKGTPVYAMGNWVVTKATRQGWYGNVVVIKHTLPDWSVLHSTYAHLDSITTQQGWKINEWDQLWTVGNEWFSFGNHLLWVVNRTPSNTYAFRWCEQNGNTFNDVANIVNNGLCRDYLVKRTLDPIAFVETNGNIKATEALMARWSTTQATTQPESTKPVETTPVKRAEIVPLAPIPEKTPTTKVETPKPVETKPVVQPKPTTPTPAPTQVAPKPVTQPKPVVPTPAPVVTKPIAQQQNNDLLLWSAPIIKDGSVLSTATLKTDNPFLKNYTITVTPHFDATIAKWSSTSMAITITDANWKPFVGLLQEEISIMPSQQIIDISPRIIRYASEKTILLMYAKGKGTTDLVVSYGNTVLWIIVLTIK